jgi:hypothetical protein
MQSGSIVKIPYKLTKNMTNKCKNNPTTFELILNKYISHKNHRLNKRKKENPIIK